MKFNTDQLLLNGYKTYIGAVGLFCFALLGAILGELTPLQVGVYICGSLTAVGIRHKIEREK